MTSRPAPHVKWVVLLALAGCGRVGFLDVPDATDAPDALLVAPRCTATRIAGFDFASPGITDMGAAKVDNGYAIGVVYAPSTLWGMHLDPQLVPDTPGPNQTSPITGFTGMYTNTSLYFDGVNLDGSLSIADGTMFAKTFQKDMSGFIVAVQNNGQVGPQSVARAGATAFTTWFLDTALHYMELDVAGNPIGTNYAATSFVRPIVTASAASGPTMFVVTGHDDGRCSLFTIAMPGMLVSSGYENRCSEPYVLGSGTGAYDVAYSRDGDIYVAPMTADATSIGRGAERRISSGSHPRLVRIVGTTWIVWQQADGLRMTPIDDVAEAPIANAPPGAPDAFEVAEDRGFAVWGTSLYAITCP